MKKTLKFLGKAAVALLLIFGIYQSYGFYEQNQIQRKQAQALQTNGKQKPFVILISAHNNSTYCEKSLFSAVTQNYEQFRILYIDDASTDDSFAKITLMTSQSPHRNKISLVRNKEYKGSLVSLYDAINTCQDNEIVLLMDGSDFLAHENVLAKLNKVYTKPSVWMTYGNFLDYPSYKQIPVKCKPIPKNVVFNNSFRTHEIPEPHLKTFYAALFKHIRKEDLIYKGRFIPSENALAYLLPLLEMAGKHACFINEVLYLHTRSTPSPSAECISHIKKLPQYKRLKTLFSAENEALKSAT